MLNTENRNIDLLISWGLSLVGRAPALHAGGQEFDSPSLHQISRIENLKHCFKAFPWNLSKKLCFAQIGWIIEFSKLKLINFCDLSQFPDLTKAGKIINRIYLSWNNLFILVFKIDINSDLLLIDEDWRNELLAKLTESSVLVCELNWSCTVFKYTEQQTVRKWWEIIIDCLNPTCRD